MIAGSETGMVPIDEATVVEKGALGPGQMIGRRYGRWQKLFHDTEIKDALSAAKPFGDWVSKITDLMPRRPDRRLRFIPVGPSCAAVRLRRAFDWRSWSRSWRPWPKTAKRRWPRWAMTRQSAVLSSKYRPLSHYFRQNFSQVTNPPIDSLREYRVMSLKTRFGNLKNVLDEDSSQTEILVLDSPFVGNAQFDVMVAEFGESGGRDRLYLPGRGGQGALREALARVRRRPRMPCGQVRVIWC